MDEVHWSERLDHGNHVPMLMDNNTGSVDTGPLRTCAPADSLGASLLYQPKYKDTVYKINFRSRVVNHLGVVVYFSGLHCGVSADNVIWRRTLDEHPLLDGALGSGAGSHAWWRR